MEHNKKKLTFWQIWNMSFGFLGIQFGFALQNANVSRIFETLGASIDEIPLLWIAAPTTGLLIQPIIGHLSDKTWTKLGRRRPYFLIGALLSTFALFIMPNSPYLWMAAIMLWVLDASINISMEPFRALVADLLPTEQHTLGFSMQSFFIGLGAIVASALPWIFTNIFHLSNIVKEGQSIPDSVRFSFYVGGVVFLLAVLWTILKTKEYPPKEISTSSKLSFSFMDLKEIGMNLISMPETMKKLAFIQFFTWLALFSMWIYMTSAVTSHIYGATKVGSNLYNEGANWVGVCFAAYSGFAAIFAFLMPVIAQKTNKQITHTLSLIFGGGSLISIYFITNPIFLIFPMIGIGIAWASIVAMPYAILANTIPTQKMGVYMGIFNFFIVIPQIVAAGILGPMTKYLFGGHAIYTIIFGGCSMIVASILTLFINNEEVNESI